MIIKFLHFDVFTKPKWNKTTAETMDWFLQKSKNILRPKNEVYGC
jgi:hypothetical protein